MGANSGARPHRLLLSSQPCMILSLIDRVRMYAAAETQQLCPTMELNVDAMCPSRSRPFRPSSRVDLARPRPCPSRREPTRYSVLPRNTTAMDSQSSTCDPPFPPGCDPSSQLVAVERADDRGDPKVGRQAQRDRPRGDEGVPRKGRIQGQYLSGHLDTEAQRNREHEVETRCRAGVGRAEDSRAHHPHSFCQPSDLNDLNVVHITGTKGKGSTSAFCDSLLRSHRRAHPPPPSTASAPFKVGELRRLLSLPSSAPSPPRPG